MTLKERLLEAATSEPGLTDRQLADRLLGRDAAQQPVNIAARSLVAAGLLVRSPRTDGLLGNYPSGVTPAAPAPVRPRQANDDQPMSEDQVKAAIADWLEASGWSVQVRWGHERGIDIDATRGSERWIIEAKGSGSRQPMRVNYFIAMLGETLQRMNDESARYSIALPDLKQYRGLWGRLPELAKARTTITLLLVHDDTTVEELS